MVTRRPSARASGPGSWAWSPRSALPAGRLQVSRLPRCFRRRAGLTAAVSRLLERQDLWACLHVLDVPGSVFHGHKRLYERNLL